MFKFLKLRISVFGDARRHVPFGSIIHKPIFLIFALLFSFVCIVPVKVSAAAPQLTPEFKPILDTDIVNFQDSYLNLDPAAQAAANILFGAYVTEYAGLADYGTVFDEVPTDGTVWDRLEFVGQQLVDTFFLPYNMADQLVLTPLINLGQGIIQKVKNISDLNTFKSDLMDSGSYGLYYSPDIGFALNQTMARAGGLYNWQFKQIDISNIPSITWNQVSLPTSALASYASYSTNFVFPVHANADGRTNMLVDLGSNVIYNGLLEYWTYNNLFLNISNHTAYLADDNGNLLTSTHEYIMPMRQLYYRNGQVVYFYESGGNYFYYAPYVFDANESLRNVVYNIFSDSKVFTTQNKFDMSDFVSHIYYGNDWNSKQLVDINSDLGFSQTDSLELLNPIKDAVFDLKALIEQIVQAQPDPNYELPLQPIIYNITQVEGYPLTAEDLEGISFNVTPPESGIDVPVNVFLPFFDDGKGFISYMWYMTKPLVAYTRSFLDAITFDPVDGFNASGPGYFILGVAGLGLIGGVIVKFLL